jgi:hypothetical protein
MGVPGTRTLPAAILAVAMTASAISVAAAGPRSSNYSMDYVQVAISGGQVQSADYGAMSLLRASGPSAALTASADYTVEPVTGLSADPQSSVCDWSLY